MHITEQTLENKFDITAYFYIVYVTRISFKIASFALFNES